MASNNGYRVGLAQEEEKYDEEKTSSDLEEAQRRGSVAEGRNDPFGDETKSEVKYRTMAWW